MAAHFNSLARLAHLRQTLIMNTPSIAFGFSFPRPRSLMVLAAALLVASSSAIAQVAHVGGPHREAPRMPSVLPRAPSAIYRANCGTCHGPMGGGGTSWIDPAYLAPPIAGASTAWIKGIARVGRIPAMPAFPEQEISDEELAHLAAYISGLPGTFVPDPAYDATVLVLDEDPWFSPVQITVQPGQTVRFLNNGKTYHPVIDHAWLDSMGFEGENSGALGPNGTYYRTFPQAGAYPVLCGAHPYMRGEVHVGQGFTPPTYSLSTPLATPPVPGVGEVWVCAQFQDWPNKTKDGVVQVIDAATWTVTHTIPVGNNPHNLWFGAGGAEALVTNWFDVSVSRIDATTKVVTADCVAGATPAHVTSDASGQHWYVSIEGSRYIQRFDQGNGLFSPCGGGTMHTQTALVSGYGPHGIWYANGKLVTANSMDSTFSIVNATTMLEVARLPAGMHPLGASANAAGTVGASGNVMGNSVSIFDLVSPAAIREIPLAGGAIQVPFTPDGTKVFASNGSRVTVIDVAKAVDVSGFPDPTSAILAEITTGKGAHGIAYGAKSGGGTYAYVTHKFENYVSVIDLATLTHVGDVPLVTTTTGKVSLAGATDTGGNGIAVRP